MHRSSYYITYYILFLSLNTLLLSSEVYRMNGANAQKTNTEIEKTASPKRQTKNIKQNARTVQKKKIKQNISKRNINDKLHNKNNSIFIVAFT